MEVSIHQEVEELIQSLETATIAKVLRTIDLLERFGHRLGLPHSKSLRQGLFELRIRGKQEIRIFYAFHKEAAILISGYIKKTQQTPQKEIQKAQERIKELT